VDLEKLHERQKNQLDENKRMIKTPKEAIFIGRSNVGKSSLINSIFKEKLSNVSKRPGTTKAMQFYQLKNQLGYIADAPGYGFAQINVSVKKKWIRLIKEYLRHSTRLCRVYFLINMEHGIKESDFEYLDLVEASQHNFQVVLMKSDKVKDHMLFDKTIAIGQQLKQYKFVSPVIHLASSKTGFGIDFLRASLVATFTEFSSKVQLQELKMRERNMLAESVVDTKNAIQETTVTNIKVPPPDEMYKLLIKGTQGKQ